MTLKMKWLCLVSAIFSFAFVSVVDSRTASAADPPAASCKLGGYQSDQRPAPLDRATAVNVGMSLIDVTAIEDTSQSISADFGLLQIWKDPRLIGYEGCRFALKEVWSPQIDVANAGRVFTRLRETVEVLDGGRVQYTQRYRGAFVFFYDAHRFPFDSHRIVVSLLS